MGNTREHTHYCPHCDTMKPCEWPEWDTVGCLFPSSSAVTCEACERVIFEGPRQTTGQPELAL